jgi:steroid delta-isomerase-like uncharacterized protein
MSNKDLARRFYEEVFNRGDLDAVDELCAQDIVDHEAPPEMPKGIEGVKAFVTMFREAFPDIRATIEDMLEEGDRLAVRVKYAGTHEGDFMGVPPSGKRFEVDVIDIVRLEDGKAVEHWGVTDNLGLMQQIGAIPAEAGAQA